MEFPDLNGSLGIHKLSKTVTQENKMANRKKTNADTGKSFEIRTQNNNGDTNAGRDRPSLNGLKMRVPFELF